MKQSRLNLIPADVQGEIISNLNPIDILQICRLKEFETVCNNEYFWQRYAEKWKISKIAKTWKNTIIIRAMYTILFDYGPNYNVYYGIRSDGDYIIEEQKYANWTVKRFEYYLEKRKYLIKDKYGKQTTDFHHGKSYLIYKPYNQYLERINLIIPYNKVIIKLDSFTFYEHPEILPCEEIGENYLPPLSSKNYIIITKPFEEVLIDRDIKGEPIIIEDILFASRAFMFEPDSQIDRYDFVEENDEKLILVWKVTIYNNKSIPF